MNKKKKIEKNGGTGNVSKIKSGKFSKNKSDAAINSGRKTNVYFYFGSHAHPYYEKIIKNMPENITCTSSVSAKRERHIAFDRYASVKRTLKKIILYFFQKIGVPKIAFVKAGDDVDVIHAAQYLLITNKPYVVDFEDISALTWYDARILAKPHVRWLIKRMLSSKRCVGIMPWTEAAKKSMLNSLPNSKNLEHKVKILYPGYVPKPAIDRRRRRDVRFLFVGKVFYEKGGLDTILAFEKLAAKLKKDKSPLRVKLTIVSAVPKDVREKYEKIKGLTMLDILPPEEVDKLYKESDVFVLPTHFDTFGFVFIEAMSYGLPCIGVDNFSCPEIITQGKTGLLVRNFVSRFDRKTFVPIMNARGSGAEKYMEMCMNPRRETVDDIYDAMLRLAADKKLRESMAANARKEVAEGKFSIANMKKLLEDAYH